MIAVRVAQVALATGLLFIGAVAACAQAPASTSAETPAETPSVLDGGAQAVTPPDRDDASTPRVDASPQQGACGCADYDRSQSAGTLGGALTETSGLAASRQNKGVLYAHNDSGDTARIFAIDQTGATLGEITVSGATAVDWEDIAVGPCAGGGAHCVWIGDVGNNGKNRTDLALYELDEPPLDGKTFATKTIGARKYPFAYPDGNHDCEALLVHPKTGEVFVVTKDAATDAGIYKFPQPLVPSTAVTLQKVGTAKDTQGKQITGGDVSPCGDRVLLRAYFGLLEYTFPPAGSLASALATTPKNAPMALELQSEAIAYRADGLGYFTAPEGSSATLSFVGCK